MGFHLAHQIQRLESILFEEVVRYGTIIARNNRPLGNDLDCSMHETWMKHMTNGYFLLYQRRASENVSAFSEPRSALTIEGALRLGQTKQNAVMLPLGKQVYTIALALPRRNDQSKGGVLNMNAALIPVLPIKVDEVIFLWRYGFRDAKFKPERLLENVEAGIKTYY